MVTDMPHTTLDEYSRAGIIYMCNQKLTKVVWSPLRWSTTPKKRTIIYIIDSYFFYLSQNPNKSTLTQVQDQAVNHEAEPTRIFQKWGQQHFTNHTKFTDMPHETLYEYSSAGIIYTYNQQLTNVVRPHLRWSTTQRNKWTIILMLGSYFSYLFWNFNKSTLVQVQEQVVTCSDELTRIFKNWYQHTCTNRATFTDMPQERLDEYSNARLQIMTHHQFMAQFCDCPI